MRVLIHDFIAIKQEGFDNVIVYGWLSKLVAAAVDNIDIWLLRNWVNPIYSSKVSRTFRPMANNPPGWKSHEVKWQYHVDMLPSIKTHARFHVMIDSWTVYDMSHNDVAWPSWPLKSTTTRLFAAQFVWATSQKTSKLLIALPSLRNPPMIDGVSFQRANNAENFSMSWRHLGLQNVHTVLCCFV